MKIIINTLLKITLFLALFMFSLSNSFASCNNFFCLWDDTPEIQYCKWDSCTLNAWIDQVGTWIHGLETKRTFSQYIQDVVAYLIGFMFLVALVFVLYAWFNILTSSWDDEKVKNSKKIITNVIIWVVVIFLAYSIVSFIMEILRAK